METFPIVLAGTLILILASAYRSVRGTTLQAAWGWALFSAGSLCLAELVPSSSRGLLENLRLAAALTTFCPLVAVLGAKRPQSRAWQLIVLSLWVVLVLPVAESYFAGRGAVAKIHDARGWFLIVLIMIGVGNYAATRYWPSCWLVAAAQVMLLAGHLPLFRRMIGEDGQGWALGCLATAALLARCGWPGRGTQRATVTDRIWIDYRDWFGMLWGLRMAQRLNDSALKHNEKIRLNWAGLEIGAMSPSEQIDAERGFRERFARLLLRFVSPDWLQRRTSEDSAG